MLRVQSLTGMRPGEALHVTPDDVLLPPEDPDEPGLFGCTLIRLKDTKRGRAQVVAVKPQVRKKDIDSQSWPAAGP